MKNNFLFFIGLLLLVSSPVNAADKTKTGSAKSALDSLDRCYHPNYFRIYGEEFSRFLASRPNEVGNFAKTYTADYLRRKLTLPSCSSFIQHLREQGIVDPEAQLRITLLAVHYRANRRSVPLEPIVEDYRVNWENRRAEERQNAEAIEAQIFDLVSRLSKIKTAEEAMQMFGSVFVKREHREFKYFYEKNQHETFERIEMRLKEQNPAEFQVIELYLPYGAGLPVRKVMDRYSNYRAQPVMAGTDCYEGYSFAMGKKTQVSFFAYACHPLKDNDVFRTIEIRREK